MNLIDDEETSLTVLTNSRYSIMHSFFHVPFAIVMEKEIKEFVEKGLTVYGYSGEHRSSEEVIVSLDLTKGKSSNELHGKSMLIEGEKVIVSSYNFDPRSKYYSAENMVIFEDANELNQLMKIYHEELKANSFLMKEDGTYEKSELFNRARVRREKVLASGWVSIKAFFINMLKPYF